MSGIFEELEMFDEGERTATRQAIAVANKRFNDQFGEFLKAASSEQEFTSRLALVNDEINAMVDNVAYEYGGDASKIASAIKRTASMTYVATCDCDGNCKGECSCGGCDSCKCSAKKEAAKREEWQKAQDEEQESSQKSTVPPWLTKQDDDEDQEDGGNRKSNVSSEDDSKKCKKCDKKLDKDQKDDLCSGCYVGESDAWKSVMGSATKDSTIDSDPTSYAVPPTAKEGYNGDIAEQLESAPSAIGVGTDKESAHIANEDMADENSFAELDYKDKIENYSPRTLAEEFAAAEDGDPAFQYLFKFENEFPEIDWRNTPEDEIIEQLAFLIKKKGFDNDPSIRKIFASEAHKVEEKDDKFYVVEDGENAAGPFDSKDEANARAKELNELENLEKSSSMQHKSWAALAEPLMAMLGPLLEGGAGAALGGEALGGGAGGLLTKMLPGMMGKGVMDAAEGLLGNGDGGEGPVGEASQGISAGTPAPVYGSFTREAIFNINSKDEWVNEGDTVTEDGEEKKVEDIAQHGNEKVVELSDGSVADIDDVEVAESKTAAETETGDKTEKRENLPTGDEDANDGPSPKMDKTKWKPNATNPEGNLKPIDTEDEHSPVPSRKMDIKQTPDYKQDTLENLKKYDNDVWEREELKSDDEDNAGFNKDKNVKDQPTKAAETWSDESTQANPVDKKKQKSSAHEDIIEELITRGDETGDRVKIKHEHEDELPHDAEHHDEINEEIDKDFESIIEEVLDNPDEFV